MAPFRPPLSWGVLPRVFVVISEFFAVFSSVSVMKDLRLNLGCGENLAEGFLNVDKFGTADMHWDLEKVPWPWANSSVKEVVLFHVLEHLGPTRESFLSIIQELYRICEPDALVHITVPHPRHDDFLADPTHVRPITIQGMKLFSKAENLRAREGHFSNSRLAEILNVDFQVIHEEVVADPSLVSAFDELDLVGEDRQMQMARAVWSLNNAAKEIRITLKVVK